VTFNEVTWPFTEALKTGQLKLLTESILNLPIFLQGQMIQPTLNTVRQFLIRHFNLHKKVNKSCLRVQCGFILAKALRNKHFHTL
jgi:hypothetical protein